MADEPDAVTEGVGDDALGLMLWLPQAASVSSAAMGLGTRVLRNR